MNSRAHFSLLENYNIYVDDCVPPPPPPLPRSLMWCLGMIAWRGTPTEGTGRILTIPRSTGVWVWVWVYVCVCVCTSCTIRIVHLPNTAMTITDLMMEIAEGLPEMEGLLALVCTLTRVIYDYAIDDDVSYSWVVYLLSVQGLGVLSRPENSQQLRWPSSR